MDYKFIVLAIVGIIVAYIIYSYAFSLPGKTLTDSSYYLMSPTTNIKFNTLGSDIYTSSSLSFYAWIYVNSPTGGNGSITTSTPTNTQTLFYLNGISGTSASPTPTKDVYYAWGLDTTGQNLYVFYNTTSITGPSTVSAAWKSINVLSNIPMQSWVFVAIALDNTSTPPVMDVYMNGKLSSSIVLDSASASAYSPPMPPTGMKSSTITSTATGGLVNPSPNVDAITFGASQDVFIADLTAFKSPLTPDVVQNAYLSFAGKQNSVADGKMGYGISFTKGSGRNLISNDFQLW